MALIGQIETFDTGPRFVDNPTMQCQYESRVKSKSSEKRLLEGRMLTPLLLASFWFSASAMAIGGRGGGGEGGGRGGEGAHFGDEHGGRFGGGLGGGGSIVRPIVTRDALGNRLPGVVTADEEGGKIHGHEYDPDGVDLTAQASHSSEYAVLAGGHLAYWQSSNDAAASEATAYRARGIRLFAMLVGVLLLSIVVSVLTFR